MAIDVLAFGAGAAANAAGNLISERVSPDQTVQILQEIATVLGNIHRAVARNTHEDLIVFLSPSPAEYTIPDKGREHLSILVPSQTSTGTSITSTSLTFFIPGVGRLIQQVFVGWTQLDLPSGTIIQTNDSNSYTCILSFRDDPLGDFL